MIKNLTSIVIVLSLIALGCATSSRIDERSPGEIAFEENCQTCHRLPMADSQSDEEWPTLVARYGERAKINDETVALIASYLINSN